MASRSASRTVMRDHLRAWRDLRLGVRLGAALFAAPAGATSTSGGLSPRSSSSTARSADCDGTALIASAIVARLLKLRRGRCDSLFLCGESVERSSPSTKSSAIGVLTGTSSVPSATRILPTVPSSTASTSMVALSVSISAMTSPAAHVVAFAHVSHLASVALLHGWRQRRHQDFDWHVEAGSNLRPRYHVGVKLARIRLGISGARIRPLH